LTPRLTLNLGVRYDYATPYSEARNNLFNLDYSTLPKAPAIVTGVDGLRCRDRNNFAPRVGFAWQLPFSGTPTVFRAGYGIYYAPEIAVENYDLVRNGLKERSERSHSADSAAHPATRLSSELVGGICQLLRPRPKRAHALRFSSGAPAFSAKRGVAWFSKRHTSVARAPSLGASAPSTRRRM